MIPAYGPNWRWKLAKWSPFLWDLKGAHSEFNPRHIKVAPWNRRRRPKRNLRTKKETADGLG